MLQIAIDSGLSVVFLALKYVCRRCPFPRDSTQVMPGCHRGNSQRSRTKRASIRKRRLAGAVCVCPMVSGSAAMLQFLPRSAIEAVLTIGQNQARC